MSITFICDGCNGIGDCGNQNLSLTKDNKIISGSMTVKEFMRRLGVKKDLDFCSIGCLLAYIKVEMLCKKDKKIK